MDVFASFAPSRRRRRSFASVEHLSPEAVAAFSDGEMPEAVAHRARVHLVLCEECRRQTHQQRGASAILRGKNFDEELRAPKELVARLVGLVHHPPEDGPGTDSVPCAAPEDFWDRVETTLRTFKRMHGH